MYLNLIQIAESFGVSESVVDGWIKNEGLPHTPDRGRLMFDRSQVAEWAAKRGLAAQAGFLAPETSPLGAKLQVGPLLRVGGIWRDVSVLQLPAILERIVHALPGTTAPVRALLGQRVSAKGGVTLAPIGAGLALPHPSARIAPGRESGSVALLFLRDALSPDEAAPDDVPITRLVFFVAPSPRVHLDLLGRLSRSLGSGPLRELVLAAATDEEILQAVDAEDAAIASAPKPGGKS